MEVPGRVCVHKEGVAGSVKMIDSETQVYRSRRVVEQKHRCDIHSGNETVTRMTREHNCLDPRHAEGSWRKLCSVDAWTSAQLKSGQAYSREHQRGM